MRSQKCFGVLIYILSPFPARVTLTEKFFSLKIDPFGEEIHSSRRKPEVTNAVFLHKNDGKIANTYTLTCPKFEIFVVIDLLGIKFCVTLDFPQCDKLSLVAW